MSGPVPAAAVFDLGGVVFHYRPQRRLEAFARLTGLTPDTVRKRLMDSGYGASCDAGRLDRRAAHREGVRLLGRRLGFDTFRDAWIDAFEPDAATLALARRLRAQLPLAMLSNNSELVKHGLEARYPEVLELFRPRLFSAEAGVLKPDPRLFRTLLELLDLPPEGVLYVDDEPAYAAAAAALGMRAQVFAGAAELTAMLERDGLLR